MENYQNPMKKNIEHWIMCDYDVRKTIRLIRTSFIFKILKIWKISKFLQQINQLDAGFDAIMNFPGFRVMNARNFNPKDSGPQNVSQF